MIVVEASIEHRLSRLKLRGHTEEDALARIQSQVTDEKRREIADLVIVNDGSLEQLRAQVSTLENNNSMDVIPKQNLI